MKEKKTAPVHRCSTAKWTGLIIPAVLSWERTVLVMDVTADIWSIKEESHEKA